MTNNIQGNSHKIISWFLTETTTYLKWWKGRTYNQEYSTQQNSCSDLTEKSNLYRQAKDKRIQHHQTSFTRTTKGTSLQRKHNRRKRPTQKKTQNNQENGKIIHTDNYFKCKWIKRTKRHRLAEWMKICACMPSHLPHHST